MISVVSESSALFTFLSSNGVLVSSGFTTRFNEDLNTDPNFVPWVGVYFADVELTPHRIAAPTPWMARYEFPIFIQHAHAQDQREASALAWAATDAVMSAVNSDRMKGGGGTFAGQVDNIVGMEVSPWQLDRSDQGWLFTNLLIVTAEKQS